MVQRALPSRQKRWDPLVFGLVDKLVWLVEPARKGRGHLVLQILLSSAEVGPCSNGWSRNRTCDTFAHGHQDRPNYSGSDQLFLR